MRWILIKFLKNQLVLLIFLSFSINSTETAKRSEIKICDDETTKTIAGKAYWKYRSVRYTTSEDVLCWQPNMEELLLRECDTTTGRWLPETVNCRIKDEVQIYCPEDLVELKDGNDDEPLCIKISQHAERYNEKFCYGSNIILPYIYSRVHSSRWNSLIQYLDRKSIRKFWLPLKRDNVYAPYMIRIPGERWGQVADATLQISNIRTDKNCMSARYTRETGKDSRNNESVLLATEITNCDELLHSVCVFSKHLVTRSGCRPGFGALSHRPTECYGIEWNPTNSVQVNISEYFQYRNSYRLVLEEFVPNDKRRDIFEVGSFVKSNVRYNLLMNQEEMVRVSVDPPNTWPKLSKEVVKVPSASALKVQMLLKFDLELDELLLVVYNSQYIWRLSGEDAEDAINCFSNADYNLLSNVKVKKIFENKEGTKVIFKLKLLGDGPGEYWCEAHTIFDFELVNTTRVVAEKGRRGHPFAVRMNLPCIAEGGTENMCNNLQKYTKKIAKNMRQILREQQRSIPHYDEIFRQLIIHNLRMMHVEQVGNNYVYSWIQITASLKDSSVDNSDELSSEEDDSSESSVRIRHDTAVRIRIWRLLSELITIYNAEAGKSVRSIEYCFPETFQVRNGSENQWLSATRGQVATTLWLCLKNQGIPYTRQCLGDFIRGAFWENLEESVECQSEQQTSHITESLYNLENWKRFKLTPDKVLSDIKDVISGHLSQIVPADLYFLANIMQSSVKSLREITPVASESNISTFNLNTMSSTSSSWSNITRNIVTIYNNLMDVERSTMKLSVQLNSTNKLLEAFETAIDMLAGLGVDKSMDNIPAGTEYTELESDFDVLDYVDIGVSVKISPNLICFVIDPSIANITGVAIFRNNTGITTQESGLTGAFSQDYYRFLQFDHSLEDFIQEPNLELGTYFPEELLNRLNEIPDMVNSTRKGPPIIIIKVYANDMLFQQPENQLPRAVSGRIVSISIPGYNSDLPDLLPLALRNWHNSSRNDNQTTEQLCNYWDFKSWASDGITLLERSSDVILCGCSHLTPFAYLVGAGYDLSVDDGSAITIDNPHLRNLDIITLIGCSLSLLGISGIFITAATFQTWRKKASSKVLLQLSAAIALQMIILCFVNTEEYSLHLILNDIIPSCIALGACLHYSVLVQFFWMMIIAYLQFKRYVQIFGQARPKRFFFKSAIFCWGLPLIPVLLVIFIDRDSFSHGVICYPSGYGLYFGIIMPITIIILANFVIFCLVIYNIVRGPDAPIRHTDKRLLISQIRLSLLLFFLLGFTWIFGLLSAVDAGIIFPYLFCITAALQGFVVFIYFIVLDPVTRRMWGGVFSKTFGFGNNLRDNSSSVKETTQTF